MKTMLIWLAIFWVNAENLKAETLKDEKLPLEGLERVVTLDGRVYEKVREVRVNPAYVTVIHEGGVGRVGWENLPEGMREAYGYDQAAALAFLKAENAKEAAVRAALEKDLVAGGRVAEAKAAAMERERQAIALEAEIRAINDRYGYPSRPAPAVPTARPNGTGYRYYTTVEGKGVWLRAEE